jgi:hypothetical protein
MNLSNWLLNMSAGLGIRIDMGFELKLEHGHVIHSVARIPDFGRENGMLIVNSFDQVREYSDEVIKMGYGYSVFDEGNGYDGDLEGDKDILADWGWSGDLKLKPEWAMAPVPEEIDGAKVISYAHIGALHPPTGKVRHNVGGEPARPAKALAICRYEGSQDHYLFGCDADWRPITDTCHGSIEAAKEQADLEYEDIDGAWIEY